MKPTLESKLFGASPKIIMLHEGLGSLSTLGDFPLKLSEATGQGVYAYSRFNYGNSPSKPLPYSIDYMHEEADVLRGIMKELGESSYYLVGHSDGATIATIAANDPRVIGISLIAPHFVVEDISVSSIADAKIAYETGHLKLKLARHHANPDAAFYGWCDSWLNPEFHHYNLEAEVARITCPIQIIQGVNDQYGTYAQVEFAKKHHSIDEVMLQNCGHNPMREASELTLHVILLAIQRSLRGL
jgi:pimeloyl-ACP methyl ester carboxylesterase